MLYTLYYQTQDGRRVKVATSDSLLKLLKIEKMTFHHDKGSSYIGRTDEKYNKYVFRYDDACLSRRGHADFVKFRDAVNGGKCFKSYDYRQRVRELLNRRSQDV